MTPVLIRNISRLTLHKHNSWLHIRSISCLARDSGELLKIKISQHSNFTTKEQSTESTPRAGKPLQPPNNSQPPPTMQQKLKKAVTEYGSTVIVFHIGISLVSLGVCYVLISSGLDVGKFLEHMGISSEAIRTIAANAGTFAVAYAVHKVFAPARIMITLTATPFIVRYLRRIGVLKFKK